MDIAGYEMQAFQMESLKQYDVSITIARLDKIHPLVSGNKLYKLYYFLELAAQKNIPLIKTFGGAYSNHLLATASACLQMGLKSVGFIRGEISSPLSETLIQCQHLGMELIFLSREEYRLKAGTFEMNNEGITIPEGGYHPLGAKGADLICSHPDFKEATHIITAVGTATTLAGLLRRSQPHQQLIAVPVLKGFHDIEERISYLNGAGAYNNLIISSDYHFGGYAKASPILFDFMNQLYAETGLQTDFVYTAKMMYAATDLIKNNSIQPGSRLLCLHTGGLQGNRGLVNDTLIF